ncbi:MAG: primase, primase protein [Candidatus Parcubacteria bacterium]
MQSKGSVEAIKDRLRIEDLIGSYITIEKSGINYKARCPFHNEKTPSFFVSADRGSYYCFGCGAKGDIFSFVQQFEGVDFVGALKLLAERTGVELNFDSYQHTSKRERLLRIMEAACKFYELAFTKHKAANEYLIARGLTPETIKSWRIGWAPLDWRALSEVLLQKGITKEELQEVGLTKEGDKGIAYDRFRGRIMFPLFDAAGRVVGFSGRLLADDPNAPKYLNSPETELFKKSEILYGLDRAKRAMREKGFVLLVEGQMDLLMCHQSGLNFALATSGTALSEQHVDMIRRFVPKIVISFDADNAGRKASERVWNMALQKDMEVNIISMPHGKDPADALRENPHALDEALKSTGHIVNVLLAAIKKESTDTKILGERLNKEIIPLIAAIPQAMLRGHFVATIAEVIGVKEEIVWDDLKSYLKTKSSPQRQSTAGQSSSLAKKSRQDIINHQIWALLWYAEKCDPKLFASLEQKLITMLGSEQYTITASALESEKNNLIFQAEIEYQDKTIQKEAETLLMNLELELMRSLFAETMEKLSHAEKEHNKQESERLLALCHDYTRKINELKSKLLI